MMVLSQPGIVISSNPNKFSLIIPYLTLYTLILHPALLYCFYYICIVVSICIPLLQKLVPDLFLLLTSTVYLWFSMYATLSIINRGVSYLLYSIPSPTTSTICFVYSMPAIERTPYSSPWCCLGSPCRCRATWE